MEELYPTATVEQSENLVHPVLVDVAPEPAFAGLGGGDHRMFRGVEVFGGVFVLGRVAAAYVAALQAGAQVYPLIAHGDALGTDMRLGRNVVAVGEVFAMRHLGLPVA